MKVWKSVKVVNEQHPRNGEAGTVHAVDPAKPDEVVVRFDTDDVREIVKTADLQELV